MVVLLFITETPKKTNKWVIFPRKYKSTCMSRFLFNKLGLEPLQNILSKFPCALSPTVKFKLGGGLFHYFVLTGGFCCLLP